MKNMMEAEKESGSEASSQFCSTDQQYSERMSLKITFIVNSFVSPLINGLVDRQKINLPLFR